MRRARSDDSETTEYASMLMRVIEPRTFSRRFRQRWKCLYFWERKSSLFFVVRGCAGADWLFPSRLYCPLPPHATRAPWKWNCAVRSAFGSVKIPMSILCSNTFPKYYLGRSPEKENHILNRLYNSWLFLDTFEMDILRHNWREVKLLTYYWCRNEMPKNLNQIGIQKKYVEGYSFRELLAVSFNLQVFTRFKTQSRATFIALYSLVIGRYVYLMFTSCTKLSFAN